MPTGGAGFRPLTWTEENVEAFWSFHAQQVRDLPARRTYFSDIAGDLVVDHFWRRSGLARGGALLDFGCGPGFFLEKLAARSAGRLRLRGLEFSQVAAMLASARLAERPGFSEVRWVDRTPTLWPDETFDFVCSIEVIEHLDDQKLDAFFTEAHRLLKRDGLLLITTPNDEDLASDRIACPHCRQYFHRWQHVRSWTARGLAEHAALYGLEPKRVEATRFEPVPRRLLRRLLRRTYWPHLVGVFRKRG